MLRVLDFEKFNEKIGFDGYYLFEETIYLFFDTTNYIFEYENANTSTQSLFVLPDEIINHRKVCNIPICYETTDFFITNNSINYLYDENNEAYEHPIVGFVGKPTPEIINFTYVFGESPRNKSAILGPYYYFSCFIYSYRTLERWNSHGG